MPSSLSLLQHLEHLTVEIEAVQFQKHDIRYVMNVHHAQLQAKWQHKRSFDEYKAFQKRLLDALHHGHYCTAECPWLESFVKSYFPTWKPLVIKRMERSHRLIQLRTNALRMFFQQLHAFVCNRQNHTCAVVLRHVANEYTQFTCGRVLEEHSDQLDRMPATTQDQQKEEATTSQQCALCQEHLTPASVITLSCAHRFHDECIVPHLNNQLACPLCGTVQER